MTGMNLAGHQRFALPFLWDITILMTVAAALMGVFFFLISRLTRGIALADPLKNGYIRN